MLGTSMAKKWQRPTDMGQAAPRPVGLPRPGEGPVPKDLTQGQFEGPSLAGVAQLLVLERITCLLRVRHGRRQGQLIFREGTLVHAQLDTLSGDPAALALLAWDHDTRFELSTCSRPRRVTITRPLDHLLLEAMRLKDEEHAGLPSKAGSLPAISPRKEDLMGNINESLEAAMTLDGAIGIALVDHESGMTLGHQGGGKELNLEIAGAGNTAGVRSKLKVMQDLKLNDSIEDILITLGKQYHLIRPLASAPNLFLYLALRREKANLALARHKLAGLEKNLEV